MASAHSDDQPPGTLLSLSARLARAETVETAVARSAELARTALERPVVSVCEYDPDSGAFTTLASSDPTADGMNDPADGVPASVAERVRDRMSGASTGTVPEVTVDDGPRESVRAEAFAPVGDRWLLRLGTHESDGFDETALAVVEGIAANAEPALRRIDRQGRGMVPRPAGEAADDAAALHRLNELTVGSGAFDDTVERLLSLGCEYFGLDTGILARVDGRDYEAEAVVDATGTHEVGATYALGETMCEATLEGRRTEPLAFADVADTERCDHPAAASISAYIAAPVVVGDETYGTVNFSMATPRATPFRPVEREFVTLVAEWVGTEIERRRRFDRLERYETILEAVDDPVYALDTEGRLTFLNAAAEREFGYSEEVLGEHVSVGMDESDVDRIRGQIEGLLAGDERSTTAEFELRTSDGDRSTVENRLALIGDDEFRGTAGVLRDITARKERRQRLASFQRAVEEAADGVAILEGDEYVYVDRTHVEMYGFEDKAQLLGNTWRALYDDAEIERLEAEAFPALESEGHWRGMVTGSRPDGSTFPAELSLTIVDDGRLVCTVRDETERRERERELELKERAMDEATVGIQITDPTREGNPLVYVNDGFERMTGYTSEEVLGRNPRFLQSEDSDPEQVARLREAIDSEDPVSLELQNHRKDGTPYWSRISVTPVRDEAGTVTNYIGIQQDVTERKERTRWLRQFLNEGPLLFVETREVDGEAIVESCNDRLAERLGYDREAVEGHPLADIYSADSASELRAQGYDRALEGAFELSERELVGADGESVPTLLRAVPRQDGTDGTSALFVDVSERKRREREAHARVELLQRVYEVTTDPETGFEEKLSGLLAAGRDHLDLPYGFLTRVETDAGAGGTQTIVEAVGSHDRLQPGESGPLSESYCQRTIGRDDALALTDAGESELVDDSAYEAFGLETYVGTRVMAADEPYGTLCFASEASRASALDEFERSFVDLLGQWVGSEIERRDAREELRQQQERLELTLSATNTGIIDWNVETDELTLNRAFRDLVGRQVETAAELFETVIHPEDRERARRATERMLETGELATTEYRVSTGSGDTLWLRSRATPRHDEDGNPADVLAVVTDITDRKEKERAVSESRRQYRTLARNIPNGAVLTFDDDLRYELAAGELLSTFDIAASDIAGERVGTLGLDIDDELVSRFEAALDGERTDRRVTLGDRTVRVHIVPVEADDEEPTDIAGLLLAQDVTEEARRERELFEERERFRLLTESVDEYAFLTVDEDGRFRTWNAGAEALYGYDAEEALGMSIAELHPESDRESGLPERLLQQARISGESAHEGWRVRADGSEFYADVRYAPLESDDGEFRGYAKIVRDMTERRRQRRRTERFVEEANDVVTIVDTDGTIEYASGSADRILGYDPDDLVGENLFDYLHPESREGAMETFFTGMGNPDADLRMECRMQSGDGEWRNVETQCRNLLDDDAVDGMLLYLKDVTEEKKRARQFESIFNQTFQFTGLLNPDGTVVEVNDATLEFGGIERDEIAGRPFADAQWFDGAESARADARGAIERAADGEFVRYETEVRGADGLATVDFSLKPVRDDDGDVSMLVAEGRDITVRQQQRRHTQVLQRVMRHNMRNDLMKVRGWAQMMCEEPDAERRAEHLETVEEILDKWEAMTEKTQEMRRILQPTSGREATTTPDSLIADAVDPVREAHDDATVLTEVPDDWIRAPATLAEAVAELVRNAVEAREDATVEVALTGPTDGWAEVVVRDDGPGMPEMEADVLENGEETPLNHGQGLGLWMVRMIVTGAGGEASVESTADGTTVRLRLPVDRRRHANGPIEMTE